jgi:hypothetical protein
MERRGRKGSSSARREQVTEKNGGILFDRPKPTVGCSANGSVVVREFESKPPCSYFLRNITYSVCTEATERNLMDGECYDAQNIPL